MAETNNLEHTKEESAKTNNAAQATQINPSQARKKKSPFTKFLILLLSVCLLGYFGFSYLQDSNIFKSKADLSQSNDDGDIFDISDEHNIAESEDTTDGEQNLSELEINEFKEHVREKGADFVYRALLKNQVTLNSLKTEIAAVKEEMLRYKNREKVSKIIFSYVELRQELFATNREKNHSESLKNFEMLAKSDDILKEKALRLTLIVNSFRDGIYNLNKNFQNIIPQLLSVKNNTQTYDQNSNLINKLRNSLSKLIIIRKLDEKDSSIDGMIVRVEQSLKAQSYYEALVTFSTLHQIYLEKAGGLSNKSDEIISDFLNDLTQATKLQEVDQEIMSYLDAISN